MSMRDLWAAMARRWTLTLCCLAATAGLALFAASKVPPTYESTADVVLVPPKSTEDPTANRYLSLSGLRQAVDVLTRSLGSDSTEDQIKKAAPGGAFETTADFTTSAPILIITAKAPTARQAQELLNAVVAQVPVSLAELQRSVQIDTKHRITHQVVAEDEKPKAVNKKQVRVVGASIAFALLLSAMVIGAVDNVLQRRARAEDEAEAINDLVRSLNPQLELKPRGRSIGWDRKR